MKNMLWKFQYPLLDLLFYRIRGTAFLHYIMYFVIPDLISWLLNIYTVYDIL